MKLDDDALRAGYRLNSFETLGSTNDEALARAAAGDRGKLWIVAAAQSAGRGRQGRAWFSPPGNLYASLLLVDAAPPAKAWQLGFVAGVALADAVTAVLGAAEGARIAIKWPNDLLAGEAKVAGILVEGTTTASGAFAAVIGIGVNCATHPDGTPYPTTTLAALSPLPPSRDTLFVALTARLPGLLALWDGGRGFAQVRDLWLGRALARGTRMVVTAHGHRRAGGFRSIDPDGRLILDTAEGPVLLDVGDVLLAEARLRPGDGQDQ